MSPGPEPPLPKGMTPPAGRSDADPPPAAPINSLTVNYAAGLRAWLEDCPLRIEDLHLVFSERPGVPPRFTATGYIVGVRDQPEDQS